jgi:hypothetical protein
VLCDHYITLHKPYLHKTSTLCLYALHSWISPAITKHFHETADPEFRQEQDDILCSEGHSNILVSTHRPNNDIEGAFSGDKVGMA